MSFIRHNYRRSFLATSVVRCTDLNRSCTVNSFLRKDTMVTRHPGRFSNHIRGLHPSISFFINRSSSLSYPSLVTVRIHYGTCRSSFLSDYGCYDCFAINWLVFREELTYYNINFSGMPAGQLMRVSKLESRTSQLASAGSEGQYREKACRQGGLSFRR